MSGEQEQAAREALAAWKRLEEWGAAAGFTVDSLPRFFHTAMDKLAAANPAPEPAGPRLTLDEFRERTADLDGGTYITVATDGWYDHAEIIGRPGEGDAPPSVIVAATGEGVDAREL